MATTTNYGWTTPDDTALVKDGAAAIRTLGSSVDTTTKALNPSTTLGDIEYRSSTANTNTRLGIGSTGQVLTVSGGVPAWAAPASSGGMTLISTTTLSGSSTTISSIPGTYKSLVVYLFGIDLATDDYPSIKPNNTDNVVNIGLAGSPASFGSSNELYITSGSLTMTAGNTNNAWTVHFDNYASSTNYKPVSFYGGFRNTAVSTFRAITGGGMFKSNTAITSLVFTSSGGISYNGGTVLLYGVN